MKRQIWGEFTENSDDSMSRQIEIDREIFSEKRGELIWK